MPSDHLGPVSGTETPETFYEEYQAALASQRWERVGPLIHQSCTVVFSSGTFEGIDQVEAAFRRTFDLIEEERYAITNLRWLDRSENRAIAIYDFAWEGLIDGKPASGGGRGTSVLIRERERWQMLLEHLGPPAPGPSPS